MIFYFTVSSVYSFGKTFLTEESEKNGNFLLKDRPAAGLSAADGFFFMILYILPGFFRQKSENLLVSVILSANDFSHG